MSDSSESEDNDMGHICFKHSHKKAKYIVMEATEETEKYQGKTFCSRCAIKLVTLGLKVEELSNLK